MNILVKEETLQSYLLSFLDGVFMPPATSKPNGHAELVATGEGDLVSAGVSPLKKTLISFSRSAKSTLRVLIASVIFLTQTSSSGSSVPSTVCLWPYC